jgi:hypothetical protein
MLIAAICVILYLNGAGKLQSIETVGKVKMIKKLYNTDIHKNNEFIRDHRLHAKFKSNHFSISQVIGFLTVSLGHGDFKCYE